MKPSVRPAPSGRQTSSERFCGPGSTLIVTFGHSQWYCARVTSSACIHAGDAAARRRAGPRTSGNVLERVAVGADVDRLGEARVGDRAVVALEVVLDRDLPVRLERPRHAAAEREPPEVDAAARRARRAARRASRRTAARRGRDATNRNGPHVATRAGRRPSPSGSRPGSRSPRGTLRSAPSRSYVHAWYGHCSVEHVPSPSSTGWPRWRQTLTSARSSPSRPRTTTSGTGPASTHRKRPGSATWSARPAYCQLRRKISSCSRASSSGSAYQRAGRLCPARRPSATASSPAGSSRTLIGAGRYTGTQAAGYGPPCSAWSPGPVGSTSSPGPPASTSRPRWPRSTSSPSSP